MWHTKEASRDQLFGIDVKGIFCAEDQLKMDFEANEQQTKQERSRTRWTSSLDKIFADLIVEQIQLGNRPNNVFDKKAWNHIREEFNRQTNLNFNNNQLRKHLDVLRTRYCSLKSAFEQNDAMDESCYIGFDLWDDLGAQPKSEAMKIKECPIYDQLCIIFADSGAGGKYAQSSHYEELDKSAGADTPVAEAGNSCPKAPSSSRFVQENVASPGKNSAVKKRKRQSETASGSGEATMNDQAANAMAESLLEMLATSKLRSGATPPIIGETFPISHCIKALDEIEGINDGLYYAALDLFDNPNLRETFLSLNRSRMRLAWLQGKCSVFPFGWGGA